MADLSFIYLEMSLTPIRLAYGAGHAALVKQLADAEAEEIAHGEAVAAGEVEDYNYDPDTGDHYYTSEHRHYAIEAAHDALNQHCKAFATMIHHAWERHVCEQNDWDEYKCNLAYEILARKKGWTIDKPRLERLRMTANCVKHDANELYGKHPEMFDVHEVPSGRLFRKDSWKTVRNGWSEALRVTDDDITDFLDAVRRSASIPQAVVLPPRKAQF